MRDNAREEIVQEVQEHEMPGYAYVEKIRNLLDEPLTIGEESKSQSIPADVRDHYNRAQGLEANNQFGKALETLLEAVNIAPTCARCWSAFSPSLLRMGWKKEAERVIDRALELDDKSSNIWLDYSALLLQLRRLDEGAKALEKCVEIEPDNDFAWVNLGSVYIALQKPDAAIEAWQEVTRINPKHSVAWFNIGSLLDALGRKTEADEAYKKFIELRPQDGPRAVALARQAAARRRPGGVPPEI
ncbi:MAG: tetratricopeptide repeat protein [Candidatus Thorarchaeota archaeon]